jgi:hypothetical protein
VWPTRIDMGRWGGMAGQFNGSLGVLKKMPPFPQLEHLGVLSPPPEVSTWCFVMSSPG